MAKNCSVTSIPSAKDTTKKSILYDYIRTSLTKDDALALKYHALSLNSKYNKYYTPENIDETGELKASVFKEKIYDVDIEKISDVSIIQNNLSELEEMLHKKIGNLQSQITEDTPIESRKRDLLIKFQSLQADLQDESISGIKFLATFIEEMYNIVVDANKKLDTITSEEKTGEIASKDIIDLVDIYNEFAAMDVFKNIEDLVKKDFIKPYLDKLDTGGKTGEITVPTFADKIAYIIREKSRADDVFRIKGIPLMADWLLEYSPATINSSVLAMIRNLRQYHRGNSLVIHDDEYKRLNKKLKLGQITKAEYDQDIENLAEQQIRNRNIITRETVIDSLQRAYRDKSAFSLYLDPFIYSSDRILGLFARALKEEMYAATMKSRDTALKFEKIYNDFSAATGRSSSNAANFNDGLYEEIEVYSNEEEIVDGKTKRKKIKRLGFIQPYDVNKFKENENKMYDTLYDTIITNLKRRNVNVGNVDLTLSEEDFKSWLETKEGIEWFKPRNNVFKKERKRIISQWFRENTEAKPGAMQEIYKVRKELDILSKSISWLEKKKLLGTITTEEEAQLRHTNVVYENKGQWWNRNVTGEDSDTLVPKGTLAQPKLSLYTNERYTELTKPENKVLFDYYTALLDQYKSDQKILSPRQIDNNPWDDFTYYLPSVPKSNNDMFIESHGNWAKAMWSSAWDAFKVRDTDTQFGITDEAGIDVKMIPVFFTHPVDSEYISKDILSSVLQFHHMVNEYEAKANIHAHITLIQNIIDNRETAQTNSLGQTIWNAVSKKFGREKFLDKNKRSNYSESLEEFIKLVYYGERMEKGTFNLLGKEVSATKLAGLASRITGLNVLAFNALQGVNNVIFGNIMFATEAIAGQFVNKHDLAEAEKIFWVENGAGLSDLGKFNAETIMGQLVEKFDPIQGKYPDMMGKNITGSMFKKGFKTDSLYFLQHGGEFQMQIQTMLGLLVGSTVKDKSGNFILNADGSKLQLYRAYQKNKDGKVELDPRVASIQLRNDPESDLTENDIRNIIHGINGKLHGKYNTFDRPALQRRWYGQLGMLFRGWMVPGIRKRWGFGTGPSLDFETGVISEGTYQSFFRLIKESIIEKQGILSTYKHMTDMEKANVARTVSELVVYFSMMLLVRGLASLDLDDDDQEMYFLLYQLRRLQGEVGFYWNYNELLKLLKSPSAVMGILSKINKVGVQFFTDPREVYQVNSGLNKKGDNKLLARARDLLPIINNIEKSLTPEDTYKWFNSPQW